MCVRGLEWPRGGAGQGIGGRFLLFLFTKQSLAAIRQKDTQKTVHRGSEPWPRLRVCVTVRKNICFWKGSLWQKKLGFMKVIVVHV